MTPSDRERALLLVADEGRTMQAEPQDVLALLDFLFGDERLAAPDGEGQKDSEAL